MCNATGNHFPETRLREVYTDRQSKPYKRSKTKTSTVAIRNLIYLEKWEEIKSACECNPCQAKVADKSGDLPLHEACLRAAPFHIIEKILSAYPDGARKQGFCGRLPIHYASYKEPSLNVIKLLLESHPEGASTIDSDGRLPLHLAVVRNAPKETIQALIIAFPKSILTPNNFGSTPQQLARNEQIHDQIQNTSHIDKVRDTAQKTGVVKKCEAVGNTLKWIAAKNKAKCQEFSRKKIFSNRNTCKPNTPADFFPTARADRSTKSRKKQATREGVTRQRSMKGKGLSRLTSNQRNQVFSPPTRILTPP